MHTEALHGIRWAVEDSRVAWPVIYAVQALDLGGAPINGDARSEVKASFIDWTAADIEPGPGIDWAFDATSSPALLPSDRLESFDVVLCTEVLEHVKFWYNIIWTAHVLLKPGGFLLLSCASTGRRPHGARGELSPALGEWYRNVYAHDLAESLQGAGFDEYTVKYNPRPGDAYAWARKEH